MIHSQKQNPGKEDNGWAAHLTLHYGRANEKTVLLKQRHTGPLMVQKPFYPEGLQTCHTYLIHPPGGVVGGDKLALDVSLAQKSHAVITTPAAGKFYRSAGAPASQVNRLHAGANTVLEWMPQETIIYDEAKVKLHSIVRLDSEAKFIGWEMVCLGLPASDQPFISGDVDQRFEIWRDDHPMLIERLRIQGRDTVLSSNWGLANLPVTGTLIASTGEQDLLQAIRDKTGKIASPGLFAATRTNGLTVCRYLGGDVYAGFKYFMSAWEILRPAVTGRKVCAPRIWAT